MIQDHNGAGYPVKIPLVGFLDYIPKNCRRCGCEIKLASRNQKWCNVCKKIVMTEQNRRGAVKRRLKEKGVAR